MRQFHTSVTERKIDFGEDFETHPYEAAWASEAICFVRVEDLTGRDAELSARVQISVDGVRWVDDGAALGPARERGDYFVKVSHFGGWLRLRGSVKGAGAKFNLTIWWVLKE